MPTQVQFRRGTTAQNNNFVGAAGELTIDLSRGTIRVHDNSTLGGTELVTVHGTSSYATNIVGGAAGSVPYQSSTGTTSFIPIGSSNTVLVSDGTSATWQSLGTLTAVGGVNADNILVASATAGNRYLVFIDSLGSYAGPEADNGVYFNIASGLNVSSTVTVGGAILPSSDGTINLGSPSAKFNKLYLSSATLYLGTLELSGLNNVLSVNGAQVVTTATLSSLSANTATNIAGGLAGSVPYQSAPGTTTFLSIGGNNSILVSNGSSPSWTTNPTIGGNLTIVGNLTVQGTTTAVDSTVTNVSDPIITLGGGVNGAAPASNDGKDRGIAFQWHNGSAAKLGFFGYDNSTGYLTFVPDATITSEVVSGTLGTLDVAAITGSAAKWTNSRTVTFAGGDVTGSFSIDGSANVSNVALTIGADSVALGTDTTGNYVATAAAGTGISVAGSGVETANITITNLGVTSATAGTGIAVDASTGSVTITNVGVTSLAGTAPIAVSGSTGSVTISLTTASAYVNRAVTADSVANALTIGAGLSGGSYNGGTAVTITNLGVTSITPGTGMATNGSTGTVTLTNVGVTSLTGGGGVTVTGSTGSVTLGFTTSTLVQTASNIAGGTAGQLHYQSAAGTTAFAGPGTSGQILVSAGTSAPTYTSTSSIYVNDSVNAEKWKTARTFTFGGDLTGSMTVDGSQNVTFTATIAADSVVLGTDTTGNYVATGATTGYGLSGSTNTEGATFTVNSNGTSSNTASTLVFRDGNGDFSARTVTLTGDLVVQGTTFTVNSTVTNVSDPIITIGGGAAGAAPVADDNKDKGIAFQWHNGSAAKIGFFGYDDSTGYMTFVPDATITNEVISGTQGDIQATNFRGTLVGSLSGGAAGNLVYQSAAGTTAYLTNGTAGQILVQGATNPTWTNTGSIYVNRAVTADSATGSAGSVANALTIGSGLSGGSFNGSSAVTITNLGVTGLTAGTGIATNGSTGSVTLTNVGVTSLAGTAPIAVSASTGSVTVSLTTASTYVANAVNAEKWLTARTITLGGDLSGSVSIDGSQNVTLTATIGADSVALGTDTTGNYVAGVSAGSAIAIAGSGAENATVTITNLGVHSLTGGGGVTVSASTGSVTLGFTTSTLVQTASNLAGGTAGQLSYQSAAGTTAFAGPGTAGQILVSAGASAPTYTNTGSIYVQDSVNATHIRGGSQGQIHYQSAVGTTAFVNSGTTGQFLQATTNGAPVFTNTASMYVANAVNAEKWLTARTLSLTGDVTGSASIDGSGNVSLATTISADATALGTDTTGVYVATAAAGTGIAVAGSGVETAAITITNLGVTSLAGTAPIAVSASTGSVTVSLTTASTYVANAVNAEKWLTARTITLGGDLSGSVSIDGSAGVTLNATIAADSVALGTDTTGNYVAGISAGSAIAVAGSGAENATVTVTNLGVHSLTGGGGVTVSASTGSVTLGFTTSTLVQTASNLAGGSQGQIHYQSAAGTTAFASSGTTGQFLQATTNGAPAFTSTASIYVNSAVNAETIRGGTAGQLVYQSGAGTTAFAGPGTAGQILVSAGTSAPTYTNTGSIYVGNATKVDTVAQTASANYFVTFVDTNNATAAQEVVCTTSTFTINPATGAISGSSLTLTGNLVVQGTTFTVNSTVTNVSDPIITIGGGAAGAAPTADDNKDRGIAFQWHNGSAAKIGFFGYDDSTGYMTFVPDATITNEVVSGTQGDIQATNFRGTLVGSVSNALTIGTGLSGGSYNGSAAVTINNLGVTGITPGTGIATNGSTGSVTLTNVGVTALTGGGGVTVSASTGSVTLGFTTSTLVQTASNLAGGTAGQLPYQSAAGTTSFMGPGTAGQILVSAGATAPTYTSTSSIYVANAVNAEKWKTARTFTFGGDLTGSMTVDGSQNVTFTATIAADSVALGTDTTGNYVASITSGGALAVAGSGAENAAVTITNLGVTALTGGGGVTVSASTGSVTLGFTTSTLVQTASNLAGGAAGGVHYQTGAGASTFLAIGSAAQIMTVNAGATAPQWTSASAITGVGSVANALTIGAGLSGGSYNGSAAVTITNLGVTALTGTANRVTVSASTGSVTLNLPQDFSTTASVQLGSLGIGTAASGTSGEIRATNEITAYYSSDARLKENVVVIGNAVEKLHQIRGVYFDWKDDHIEARGGEDGYFVRKHDVGVIAQEVEAVLPEVVATRDNGFKAVKYEKLVALLIEAVKEQQQQIAQLSETINKLAAK